MSQISLNSYSTRILNFFFSLDSANEARLQDIINTEFKHCTVIAVMHRLKYVSSYDKVAVIEDGSLIEYDEPSQLLSQGSRYAELVHASE